MTDIGLMVRSANPVPDSQQLTNDELSAVLLLARTRSADMDAKELTRPVEPDEEPKRSGLLVAAVAFAAVVTVIAGIAIVFNSTTDDVAPATTPSTTISDGAPTTTPVAPQGLDAEAVGVVEAMVADLNAGDVDAVATRILAADSFETLSLGELADDRTGAIGRYAYWVAVDSSVEVAECSTFSNGTTRCEIARTSPLDYSSPDPELSSIQVRLAEDGTLAFLRQEPTVGAWSARYDGFSRWIGENHQDVFAQLFSDFSDPERSATLMGEYFSLWEGELSEVQSAFVSEYVRILSEGESDAFVGLFIPGGGRLWNVQNPIVIKAERLAEEMLALRARQTVTTLSECRSLGSAVQCTIEYSGPVEDALYGGPISAPYTFRLSNDGLIEEIRFNDGSIRAATFEAGGRFLSWMQDEHSDVYTQMAAIGNRELLAESDAELWLEWAPRWAEAGRP